MARPSAPNRTQTELAQQRGPTGNIQHDSGAGSRAAGTIAVIAGVLGVLAGIIPNLGVGAVILAVVALVAGIPTMHHGQSHPGFKRARAGVVLAVIAIVLGVLNIAIQGDAFDYFTTGDDL